MAKNTKNTNTNTAENDKLLAFEAALLAAVAAGAVKADDVNAVIVKAGFDTAEAEHAAARPINKADAAKAALLAFGVNVDEVKAEASKAEALTLNLDILARAVGKYGRHAVICDVNNGTSLVTHYMLNTLAKAGRVTLADTLKYVREHLPNYASAGHYNTIKAMLRKAGYSVNVAQGSFSIKA